MFLGADAGGPEKATPTAILVMPALPELLGLGMWANMTCVVACVTAAHAAAACGAQASGAASAADWAEESPAPGAEPDCTPADSVTAFSHTLCTRVNNLYLQ